MIGIPDTEPLVISEYFEAEFEMSAEQYDHLLAQAWRHYAAQFSRYNFGDHNGEVFRVLPLRVRLEDFSLSRSQRRVLKRSGDLSFLIGEIALRPSIFQLFERHRQRFSFRPPESIFQHIHRVAGIPRPTMQLTISLGAQPIAASFFDCGRHSVSSSYTCFSPELTSRSLGILSILKIIEWAKAEGMTYYYPGYAYEEKSFYDYKKRIGALEVFDWRGSWTAREF